MVPGEGKGCSLGENNHCLKSFTVLCFTDALFEQCLVTRHACAGHESQIYRRSMRHSPVIRPRAAKWRSNVSNDLPPLEKYLFSIHSPHVASKSGFHHPEGVCQTAVVLCKHFFGPNGWGYMAFYQSSIHLLSPNPSESPNLVQISTTGVMNTWDLDVYT